LFCSILPDDGWQPRSRRGSRACAARERGARRTLGARGARAVAVGGGKPGFAGGLGCTDQRSAGGGSWGGSLFGGEKGQRPSTAFRPRPRPKRSCAKDRYPEGQDASSAARGAQRVEPDPALGGTRREFSTWRVTFRVMYANHSLDASDHPRRAQIRMVHGFEWYGTAAGRS
jgi:hypothetical protein